MSINKNTFLKLIFIFIVLSVRLFPGLLAQETAILTSPLDSIQNYTAGKIKIQGMTRNDFMDVCAIQWIPLKKEHVEYSSQTVNLEKNLTYAEIENLIKYLNASDIFNVYFSTLKSADNRPIYSLEIGTGNKSVIFMAGIHAREVANTQFLMKFATNLVNRYENADSDIVSLLSEYKIVILPCANPDGYSGSIEGAKAVNNPILFFGRFNDSELSKSKSNANGVDINRNFPNYSAAIAWNGKYKKNLLLEDTPSLNYFSGYRLGSENETKVIMNFIMNYVPYAFRFIDFHSAGRLIYAGKPHLSDEFNSLCEKTGELVKDKTGYTLYGLNHEITGDGTDGTVTDFASEVASGFIFNDKLGRLAPPGQDTLVSKYTKLKFHCSVNTVETCKTSRKEGFGLQQTSTPKMHVYEWEKYKLEDLFLSLVRE